MIHAFPKIFPIGTDYIADIFKEPVEITEKVDGSQFGFCLNGDVLYMRSKGAALYTENPEKMFKEAIDYVYSIRDTIPIKNQNTMCWYTTRFLKITWCYLVRAISWETLTICYPWTIMLKHYR